MENHEGLDQIHIRHESFGFCGESVNRVKNIWGDMMADCPYLLFEASHCRACSGFFCTAAGRKKKISNPSMCKDEEEWIECPRYLATLSPSERAALAEAGTTTKKLRVPIATPITVKKCPYLGPRPDGGCCGMWCYGINKYLKLSHKTCGPGWLNCGRYWQGFENKMKFYEGE